MAEVEFRSGVREIPDYLADLMAGIDTYRMTYDEAVTEVNRRLARRQIDNAYDAILRDHFDQKGPS